LQRIKQGVIEAETIGSLPTLRGEVEMAFAVRFRGTEHCDAILSTVRYGHVCDWSTGRVQDNAFHSLSKLGLCDYYEFSNRLCKSGKECARERDYYHPTHKRIISQRSFLIKKVLGPRGQVPQRLPEKPNCTIRGIVAAHLPMEG
jgi:hypothetical protein